MVAMFNRYNFVYRTKAAQAWRVPADVTRIRCQLYGAKGARGSATRASNGSRPGYTSGEFDVTPGEILYMYVGGFATADGGNRNYYKFGGWNGGGNGGNAFPSAITTRNYDGGGGGGASDIRRGGTGLVNRILVAGGAGGSMGAVGEEMRGGDGGGLRGSDASFKTGGIGSANGGSQTAGGSGTNPGGLGAGGNSASTTGLYRNVYSYGGGGGGGGYYGGGGGSGSTGSAYGGHGGGGSGYIHPTIQNGISLNLRQSPVPADAAVNPSTNTHGYIVVTVLNQLPSTPPIVRPTEGAIVNRKELTILEWLFSDPIADDFQTRYDLQYRSGDTVDVSPWSLSTENTDRTYATFGVDFWAVGQWEWEVRTYDSYGKVGPWSLLNSFIAADAPDAPVITAPAADEDVDSLVVFLGWSAVQEAYQVRRVADNSGVPNGDVVGFDTGIIVSAIEKNYTVYLEERPGAYQNIQVRVQVGGIWSNWATRRLRFNAAKPPAPAYTTTFETPAGEPPYVRIAIRNGVVDDTDGSPAYNTIYRANVSPQTDEDWIRIAENVPVAGSHNDYNVASGTTYYYKVIAVSIAGGFLETFSDKLGEYIQFKGSILHSMEDAQGTGMLLPYNQNGSDEDEEAEVEFFDFAGRTKRVAEFGGRHRGSVKVSLQLSSKTEVLRLRRLLQLKGVYCYRDANGRRVFGVIPSFVISPRSFGATAAFTVEEVDYNEEEMF